MSKSTKNSQVKELIKCGKDPTYFIKKYVKIQHPTRGLIKFDTYDFQNGCLNDFVDHRFNLILQRQKHFNHSNKISCCTKFYKESKNSH